MSFVDYALGERRYLDMSDEDREQAHDWLRLHKIPLDDTPLWSRFVLDTATNEWVVDQYRNRDGKKYIDADGEVAACVIRRQFKALPPWAASASAA